MLILPVLYESDHPIRDATVQVPIDISDAKKLPVQRCSRAVDLAANAAGC